MHLTIISFLGLISLATAAAGGNLCILAQDSCHPDCKGLRNNLNICLCNSTSEDPELACKNAQVAYTNCAMKKCVEPAQRRFEDVGEEPKWIVVGGNVVKSVGDEEDEGKLTRREKKCWKFFNQNVFCKDV
ncbi:Nn.00g097240.m01.CDS01 [Neocucurbitaria sp. VM-36]